MAAFTLPAAGSNCAGSADTVAPTLGAGATAGTFSAPAGLAINATTGVISLASSQAGTYVITNTIAASGVCTAATATATFTVNPTPPQPTITSSIGGGTETLTSSAAAGNQWYRDGVLVPGATNQTIVVAPAQRGSYTVVVTSVSGCASAPSVPRVVLSQRASVSGRELRLYPNPSRIGQVLTVELIGFKSAESMTFTLMNTVGQQVARVSAQTSSAGGLRQRLELPGYLAAGLYTLRVTGPGVLALTRRVVLE